GIRSPHQRPSAVEWKAGLWAAIAQVEDCRTYPKRHMFSNHLWGCPWCALDDRGTDPFPPVPQPAAATTSPRESASGVGVPLLIAVIVAIVIVIIVVASK